MATKKDKLIFFLWPIAASILSLVTNANFFLGTIFYLVIPSIYLSYKNPRFIGRSAILTTTTLPILVVFEYVGIITGSWFFPTSIFPFRVFGEVVTVDVLIWYFAWVYLIVMYYEFFLDKHFAIKLYYPRLKYVFVGFLGIFVLFLFLFPLKLVPKIPYFYLTFGLIVGAIPTALVLLRFPNLFTKFAKAALYFFYLFITWELVALTLGHWSFPDASNTFIGWVELFGLRFPIEEPLVWMVLGTTGILSWFEFFDDDKK